MATQQVNLYSPSISDIRRWADAARVARVMQATGCTADDARDYLVAEEGDEADAILSYRTAPHALRSDAVSGAEQALHSLRLELLELPPKHRVLKAMERLEQYMEKVGDLEKGLAEWRAMALAAQAKVKHQADCRESELVTLLKDILHCSDVFVTFRPDLHARLLDFGRRLKAQEPRDDFPDDYEV